ncbi:MAG TPA: hypothetical protein VK933_11520 [Longimicrobiales bacterium]|nr:hypothetical protein [Longimicrobiales bacterium]
MYRENSRVWYGATEVRAQPQPKLFVSVPVSWEWDGTAWQQIHVPGPPARMIGGAATDHATDRIILFSRWTADQTLLDDTWAWDGS